ncbi:MAG: hypothetical protein IM600_03645 [Bacteroidetes bacterium]|nr:hypothetical protein [Bacteroidota bacterium]MCA6442502.1 hypothetical protein [Bacteroidota bacterium]
MNNKTKDKQTKPAEAKKGSGKKWLLLGLSVAATGALSYFGFQYWKKHKQGEDEGNNNMPDTNEETQSTYVPPKPKTQTNAIPKDAFPLSKGSKGANVKALQEALIAKYGKAILPKYGADSDFGSEMVTALKKVGLPESVNETTFNLLVKGSSPDHATVAKDLYAAALTKNFNKAMSLLKTLRNTEDYKAVSDTFVNYRIGSVRQTLVNGMLNSFTDAKQKDAIRLAFSNMGLKYDGNKWSLSGIDDAKLLITIQDTQVWKNPRASVRVPRNMVLGKAITTRGAYTLFENENQYFLVQTQHIKEHN